MLELVRIINNHWDFEGLINYKMLAENNISGRLAVLLLLASIFEKCDENASILKVPFHLPLDTEYQDYLCLSHGLVTNQHSTVSLWIFLNILKQCYDG
jgi:hypothetical protein